MHEIIIERLGIIIEHADTILIRSSAIVKADDFIANASGKILLDSIITRLQALGENIKKIQKLDDSFFANEIPMDVTPIIRFRDLSSHHYESLNHEIIFAICKSEVPLVKNKIESYLQNFKA